MKFVKLIFAFLFCVTTLFAQDSVQTFLALGPTGVAEFHKTYPEYDGRGTIIFILDTGVDMGVEGLTQTTTGEIKVIDVQDFTGQGDTKFFEADTEEEDGSNYFVNENEGYKVKGAEGLSLSASDENYFIGVLKEKLWLNSGSRADDLNGDGDNEDQFYFVTFQTTENEETFWVVYFDSNGNGDLSDEKPIRNYKERYDSFFVENESSLPPFTMGINIFPDKNLVSFYFDDGGHGTNCAGIAAGNRIGGTDFFGVAPGANVVGLKLGNNNFAGGATVTESMKKSFDYFAKVAAETDKPCIVNMSFGIGSEIEGHAEIEKYLEKLTEKNPYLYICTSNGNEGPGLSTAGMPSASSAIFSSGAILTTHVGTDMYGAELNNDVILHFSSRGGEVMKPDVVSPGASASTMPNFAGRDRMWGTSMASPYSAGVISLLLSAVRAEYPEIKVPAQLVYKVVRESAVTMDQYNTVDQGGGYINILNAYKLMKKYLDSGELKNFETYTVSALSPTMPDNRSTSLYLRNGSYLTENDVYTFTINRNNFIDKKKFYRILSLKSDSDWLIPIQKKIHFRNDQRVSVNVKFDVSKMKEPGLYNGVITAYKTDGGKTPEFNMMATVVIPYEFNTENNFKLSLKNKKVGVGELNRYFINVPAGGTTMKVKLSSDENTYTDVWYHLHQPKGNGIARVRLTSNQDEDSEEREYFNLEPGVWELDILGMFIATGESTYNLSVSFDGMNRIGNMALNENHNTVKVINNFNSVKTYNLSGEITGYKEEKVVEVKGYDEYAIPFVLRKNEASKTFQVNLTKEDFNKVTDYALMIYDKDGKAKGLGGLSYSEGSISIRNTFDEDSTELKFVLIPGFTNADDKMFTHVTIKSQLKSKIDFNVKLSGRSSATFYPSIVEDLKCEIKKPEGFLPPNSKYFGEIKFKDTSKDKTLYLLPIQFNF